MGESLQVSGGPEVRLKPGSVELYFHYSQLRATGLLPRSFRAGSNDPNDRMFFLDFSLNTKTVPKQIDYTERLEVVGNRPVIKEQPVTFQAVYELTGDELRLAVPRCDESDSTLLRRPATVSAERRCSMLLVLKRPESWR